MNFLVPSEAGDYEELKPKKRASDGLHLSVQSTKNRSMFSSMKPDNRMTYDIWEKL